ncbi:alpha/beta fold hydrolase [Alteraurantiacibacter buctensis]|uniref:Alpha/beta fold hydrolase n=1 Tax=Alteraurantiacibacter buctensis TaxID=1503981 RepID=A0A844YWM6_9SPHN|nr:alpha/beta hydrolase [Alteraurantiacibacter buctensis]MXO72745.1 alpha/beta fold hydrolase [Alteraurantiacibacter buctensis]
MDLTGSPASALGNQPAFNRRAIPAGAHERLWQAADGWPIRLLDWPAPDGPARGSILFLPGRGDAYEKYLETLEHWRRQGWQVGAADWRGQAGSGRLGTDAVTGHIGDFGQWVDDLAALWRDWTQRQPGPHVLAAHSMGGQVVLRAAVDHALHPPPDALVLSTPMLGTHPEWLPDAVQQAAAHVMCLLGDPRRPAWKWSEKPGELPPGRQALLTHDEARYADEGWWRQARPELVMGPGSWGWVEAAARSMRHTARADLLAGVTSPVFLLATSGDRLVSLKANRRAARHLPRVTYLEMGDEARHEILREVDAVRNRALTAIDAFLDRFCPPKSPG